MKVNDINETLLAEIIEQNGKMQEDLLGMKKAIDGLSEDHTKFANQFSPMLKSNEFEEMIPKKDAEERARFLIRTYVDLQGRYTIHVRTGETLTFQMAPGGGFVARFSRKENP